MHWNPICSMAVALVAMSAVLATAGEARPVAKLYVATNGNDAWSGRLPAPNAGNTDGPLASLEGARNRIRVYKTRLGEIVRDVAEPTIAVVGAGFTGIELALELRDRLLVHGADGAAERLRIVLTDRAETIGPDQCPNPRSNLLVEASLSVTPIS